MSARLLAPAVIAALFAASPAFAAPDFTPGTWTTLAMEMRAHRDETGDLQKLKAVNPMAAQRCAELRADFNRTIAENRTSPKAVEARIAAENGGQLCATGLYDAGLTKLQAAIDELAKPVA